MAEDGSGAPVEVRSKQLGARTGGLAGVLLCGFVLAGLSACASASDAPASEASASDAPTNEASGPQAVILDYSPTLSDVPALLYLASHPDIDLVAVTLPGTGESDCGPGVRNTVALLTLTGVTDVPVACGREAPLVGDRDWPEQWREAANTVTGVVLPGTTETQPDLDAVDVLADVLGAADEPVVVVTLGPLTNLGLLVSERPDLVGRIERVVTMGGAFDVEGNVDAAPTAEWNLYIDPESVRLVAASGVPILFVPLDATAYVPGGRQLPALLNRAPDLAPGGEAVRQLFAANLGALTSPGWFFWDELAAVAAIDEAVVTIEDMTISIDDAGATIPDPDGARVRVATAADPAAFAEEFVDVLSGGSAVAYQPLDPTETAYIDSISTLGDTLDAALESAFDALFVFEDGLTAGDLGDAPAMAFDEIFDAMANFAAGLRDLNPPELFASSHQTAATALDDAVARRDDVVAAIRSLLSENPDVPANDIFDQLDASFIDLGIDGSLQDAGTACAEIELEAELRGTTISTACAGFAD